MTVPEHPDKLIAVKESQAVIERFASLVLAAMKFKLHLRLMSLPEKV